VVLSIHRPTPELPMAQTHRLEEPKTLPGQKIRPNVPVRFLAGWDRLRCCNRTTIRSSQCLIRLVSCPLDLLAILVLSQTFTTSIAIKATQPTSISMSSSFSPQHNSHCPYCMTYNPLLQHIPHL
jgi:hypothetical protein